MLTRWLAFTAFLAGSVNAERAAVTVAPTYRVKGQAEVALTLNCGDGKSTGVVQYWHSPFGDIQTPGFYSKLDPVFMHHDGSLVVPHTSTHHSGLYYCLLQHTEGTTLWPYELHVDQNTQKNQEHSKGHEQGSSCDAFRVRRDVGSEAERQAEVSHEQFAGAVAASVLLTFVLGFSAGALSRTHVLRCLGAVTKGLRSPQTCGQTDRPHHGSEVTDSTGPPIYDSQVFEIEQVRNNNSANCATLETSNSMITSSPPAKPQRSFRDKRQEEQETTVYLERCDYVKEEERRKKEGVAGRSLQERNKGCDQESAEEEGRDFYLLGEGGGSQSETDEDEGSTGEEKDESGSTEDEREWRQEEETEEAGEQQSKRKVEERRGSEEQKEGAERREEEEKKKGNDGENEREEDGETDICNKDKTEEGGELVSSPPRPAPRSRVIRLYQYDDDGQRYCHLPDPAPDEPRPAPRLKQRSVSLTRLNAIMAAASAGPLDSREPGREEGEERPHFHMDI